MAITYKTSAPTDAGSVNYHIQEYALAKGLGRLNSDLVITKLITNYSEEARNQGSKFSQNVRVPVRGAVSVQNKTPGSPVTPTAVTSSKADIAITSHKTWDIEVEDYGALFTQPGLFSGYLEDGAAAIAEEIDSDVFALYSSAGSTIGSAGAGLNDTLLLSIRKTTRQNKFRLNQPTNYVFGELAEEDLLAIDKHTLVNQSGSDNALLFAKIGQRYGLSFYTSNLAPAVTGSPTAEHGLVFQKEAMGIAFVDLAAQAVEGMESMPGHISKVMAFPDTDGVPVYQLRFILGYDQLQRAHILTVDTIYGVGVVRSELLIDVMI